MIFLAAGWRCGVRQCRPVGALLFLYAARGGLQALRYRAAARLVRATPPG